MASPPIFNFIEEHGAPAAERSGAPVVPSRARHHSGAAGHSNSLRFANTNTTLPRGDRLEPQGANHLEVGRTKSSQSSKSSSLMQQQQHQYSFATSNGYPSTLTAANTSISSVQCPGRSVIDRCIGFYDDSDVIEEKSTAITNRIVRNTPQPTPARTISNKYLSAIGIKSPQDEFKSTGANSSSVSPPYRKTGITKSMPRQRPTTQNNTALAHQVPVPVATRSEAAVSARKPRKPHSRVAFDDQNFKKQSRLDANNSQSDDGCHEVKSAPSSLQKLRIKPISPRIPFDPTESTALPPEVRAQLAPNPHSKKLPLWLRRLLVRIYDLPRETVDQQEDNDAQQLPGGDGGDGGNFNAYAGSSDPLLMSTYAADDKAGDTRSCTLWKKFLDRWLGKMLFWITAVLAVGSAGLTCVHSAFVMYDFARRSDNSTSAGGSGRRDWVKSSQLFDVISDVSIDLLWVLFGIYSHNLGKTTLQQPRFFNKIRMHARDILRINSIYVWLIFLGCFLVVTEVEAYRRMISASLPTTDLVPLNATLLEVGDIKITWNAAVCYAIIATRIAYAVMNYMWLAIMGCFVLSICRTHSVGVLRLTHELDKDAKFYQQFVRENMTLVSSMVRLDEMRVPPKTDGTEITSVVGEILPSPRRPPYETRRSVHPPQSGINSSFSPRASTAGFGITALGGAATAALAAQSASIAINAAGFQRSMSLRRRAFVQSSSVMDVMGTRGTPSASLGQSNFDEAMMSSRGVAGDITASMRQYRQRRRTSSINFDNSISLNEHDEELGLEEDQAEDAHVNGSIKNAGQAITGTGETRKVSVGQALTAPPLDGEDDPVNAELNQRIEQLSCNIMTNSELLYCYWKIKERMRATSVLFQSWLFIWFAFGIVWTFFDLISWLRIPPNLWDIALFVLPLLLLPLLGSAVAQANFNGQRMVAAICPLEHRVFILRMFNEMPLQLTVYGYHVTYTTLATSAVGIVLAIASKIFLDELSPRTGK